MQPWARVEGASTIVGARSGVAAGRSFVEGQARSALVRGGAEAEQRLVQIASSELLDRSQTMRSLAGATSGSVDGAVGGAAAGAADSVLSEETWEDGIQNGIVRVARDAALGATIGTATGAGVGSLAEFDGVQHLVDQEGIWWTNSYGDNHSRHFGSAPERIAVNKALEPTPHRFSLTGQDGVEQQVAVYGATSETQLENMTGAMERLNELGGYAAVRGVEEIHLTGRLGESTDAAGNVTGHLRGVAGNGTSIQIQRSVAEHPRSQRIVHHEAAHNMDARAGWFSDLPQTPFGEGATVTPYAATHSSEDFAETYADLMQNWEAIGAAPDTYFAGEVGGQTKVDRRPLVSRRLRPLDFDN